jgi:sialic acid synthase SpsE
MGSLIKLGKCTVGECYPTYFVADISANHDGELERAKLLIRLCAEAGANAAKFQHFRASRIVSDRGFKAFGAQLSHHSKWRKSVFQVYRDASIPWEWTESLKKECDDCSIDFFSAAYDLEAVDMLTPYVEMFKIGSGDITWPEMLRKAASQKKPILLATGASDIGEVQRAVDEILAINSDLVLLQCNTNYTTSTENFRHVNLRVIESYRVMFPGLVVGLSDHTPGHSTVLGAVALGARVIEKHFTDDNSREGPDHAFSMTPQSWREMISRTRELEYALGSAAKRVAENERQTLVLQRRCLRAAKDLPAGSLLSEDVLEALRPAPEHSVKPYELGTVLGKKLRRDLAFGDALRWTDIAEN